MRVLTVCEPFASALIFGGKDIENRRQFPLAMRGPLLIHAGKSLEWFAKVDAHGRFATAWVNERWPECPAGPIMAMHTFKHRMGKVIGLVWIEDVFLYRDKPNAAGRWGTGPICVRVSHPTPVTPFKLRGMQGVFTVPAASLPNEVIEAAERITELANGAGATRGSR